MAPKNRYYDFEILTKAFLPLQGQRQSKSQISSAPPIHLHLIFEISSLKNLVQQTGFFVYFRLDFYCLCSLQKIQFVSKSLKIE